MSCRNNECSICGKMSRRFLWKIFFHILFIAKDKDKEQGRDQYEVKNKWPKFLFLNWRDYVSRQVSWKIIQLFHQPKKHISIFSSISEVLTENVLAFLVKIGLVEWQLQWKYRYRPPLKSKWWVMMFLPFSLCVC